MNLKETLYSNLQTMTLEEYQKYVNEADLGYIKINSHPEDENIVILNYTEMVTFEKRWNNETMTSRGLILDLTDAKNNGIIYILAKPFEKFPNYGSNEIEGYEDDIDFTKVESIMEKMDGSLGISYFFKDEIRWATRGSFTSDQAIKATEIWRSKYSEYNGNFETSTYIYYPYTLLAEIIYPENRVVVDYDGLEDLVLLGAVDIFNKNIEPYEWSYTELQHYATDLNMPIAKQYDYSIDMMLQLREIISANEEGWIIRFENGKRLKIKGVEYLNVHRVLHGLSTKAKYKAWAEGRLQEYIMMLPEEFRNELEEFEIDVEKIADSIFVLLQTVFEYARETTSDRKSFAQYLQKVVNKDYHKFLFKAYQTGIIPRQMIKDEIAREYERYEEVINSWGTLNNQDS